MRGPIDFIIVGFEGDKFDGSILGELGVAIDKGIIDLVALSVIRKDAEGVVSELDIADIGDEYLVNFVERYPIDEGAVAEDDIDEVADLLENDTAAGLLVVEQLWAKPLKKAILEAGGVLIADGRIHAEAATELSEK